MGLNIIVYDVSKYSENGSWRDMEPEWWDTARHSGDRDFEEQIEWECQAFGKYDDVFCRPTNIDELISWVNSSGLPEGNMARLLELLDNLQENPDLWMDLSW